MSAAAGSPPNDLFHYTSAEGALGILCTGSVWASMIHYMNDAQEFQYPLKLAGKLLQESTSEANAEFAQLCHEFLAAIQRIAVFAFSLSEHKDQLSQWRAYASRGGYAIGIRSEQLRTIAEAKGAFLVKCVYKPEEQHSILKPVVAQMITEASALPEGSNALDLYRRFAGRFTLAAAGIKHPSFEEEAEWRLVSGLGVESAEVRYRSAGGLVVPYCEWSLRCGGLYPFSTVVVGPNVPNELAARSLHYLTSSTYGWPVHVEFSASPLRPL